MSGVIDNEVEVRRGAVRNGEVLGEETDDFDEDDDARGMEDEEICCEMRFS